MFIQRAKTMLLAFLLPLLLLVTSNTAFAQSADCSTFSLNPIDVTEGDSFRVIKSDGLLPGQVATARINNTSIPQQSLDCESSPSLCSENPTGLFEFDTTGLTPGTSYAVNIFYSDGANTCNTNRSFNLLSSNGGRGFCSPPGLSAVFPQTGGDEDTRFEFDGCTGAGSGGSPCGGNDVVWIRSVDAGGGLSYSQEYSISESGLNSCGANGEFNLFVNNLSIGIYTAQVYVNGSPVGAEIQFEVGSGNANNVGDSCDARTSCYENGQRGERLCAGVLERADNEYVCNLIDGGCGPCVPCNELENQVCISQDIFCDGRTSFDTAIGCIPITVIDQTSRFFLAWSLSIGGGIALTLLSYSAFLYATSQGDPRKISRAKSLMFSALSGLVLLITVVFLLQIIGVNILGLFG